MQEVYMPAGTFSKTNMNFVQVQVWHRKHLGVGSYLAASTWTSGCYTRI